MVGSATKEEVKEGWAGHGGGRDWQRRRRPAVAKPQLVIAERGEACTTADHSRKADEGWVRAASRVRWLHNPRLWALWRPSIAVLNVQQRR